MIFLCFFVSFSSLVHGLHVSSQLLTVYVWYLHCTRTLVILIGICKKKKNKKHYNNIGFKAVVSVGLYTIILIKHIMLQQSVSEYFFTESCISVAHWHTLFYLVFNVFTVEFVCGWITPFASSIECLSYSRSQHIRLL